MNHNLYLPLNEQPFFYKIFAGILSAFYSFITLIRNILYDLKILSSTRLPGTCISIGNLDVGGTGKSPFIMELAQRLIAEGHSPVILTRGYKSSLKKNDTLILLAGKVLKKNFHDEPSQYPDEAMMYSQRLPTVPVIIARDRVGAVGRFLRSGGKATHWILDDGFQHRQLARDVDVVLLDAQFPFGNGHVLPLGSLREPLSSLKRAHVLCFTRAGELFPKWDVQNHVKEHCSAPIFKLRFDLKIRSLDEKISFSKVHEPVFVTCGIAHPERLLKQLWKDGITVRNTYIVGDHDPIDRKKMLEALESSKCLLTTEKDYWRNPSLFSNLPKPCFIAKLQIVSLDSDKRSIFDLLCSNPKK